MTQKRKYADLIELSAAFRSGELEGYYVAVDNDQLLLRWRGDVNHPDWDDKQDECREWYEGRGYADLSEALCAAGIPNEPV